MQREPRIKDRKYLDSFRDKECLAAGTMGPCGGDVVGAHFRIGWGRAGEKPHDYWTAPLCDQHHRLQSRNEHEFWNRLIAQKYDVFRDIIRDALEMRYRRERNG